MKSLTLTFLFLLLVWSHTSQARDWAFPVEGSLEVERTGAILTASLTLKGGNTVKLTSFPKPLSSCTDGIFVVARDQAVAGAYRLLNIDHCAHKIEKSSGPKGNKSNVFERDPNLSSFPLICPEIYSPVCGQDKDSNLFRTFGNECELEGYGAKKVHKGECLDEHIMSRFTDLKNFGPVKIF